MAAAVSNMDCVATRPLRRAGSPRPRLLLKLRSLEAATVVHTVAFVWFARVWLWHLTPAAAVLPGAHGFGWFVRFLTFYSFSIQTVALGVAAADDWSRLLLPSPVSSSGGRAAAAAPLPRLARAADDLASVVFALAHVVTVMFYTIQAATQAMVEGDVERPPWLNTSVHLYNTLAAWGDLVTSHRTFSRSSERLSTVLVAIYLAYIQLCRHMNGQYPYPFLRNLKQPHGFIGTAAAGLLLFAGAFRVGKAINRRVRGVSLSITAAGGRDGTITITAATGAGGSSTGGGRSDSSGSSTGGGSSSSGSSGGGRRWSGAGAYALVRRRGSGGSWGGIAQRKAAQPPQPAESPSPSPSPSPTSL